MFTNYPQNIKIFPKHDKKCVYKLSRKCSSPEFLPPVNLLSFSYAIVLNTVDATE